MSTVLFTITGGQVIPKIRMPILGTIFDLKNEISEALDVDVMRQTLVAKDTVILRDKNTIFSYHLGEDATIDLHVEPYFFSFNIQIKIEGSYQTMTVQDESDLVSKLKHDIEKEWGISSDGFSLYRLSKKMEDDLPLSSYYVCKGCKIDVVQN